MTTTTATTQYRPTLARQQLAALKAWEKAGRNGPRPATPDYDACVEQHANGGVPKRRASATRGAAPTVQFLRGGRPMPDSQNRLGSLAWQATKGIGGKDVARIGTAEFRALLAKLGVADPEHTTWQVELPNGVVIGAVAQGDEAPAAPAPKATPARKAPAAKRTPAKADPGKRQVTPRTKAPAKKAAAKRTTTKAA